MGSWVPWLEHLQPRAVLPCRLVSSAGGAWSHIVHSAACPSLSDVIWPALRCLLLPRHRQEQGAGVRVEPQGAEGRL